MSKLRIGILLNSFISPAWVYRMIDEINSSDYAEIKLVILNDSYTPANSKKISTILNKHLVFNVYMKLDKKLFGSNPNAFTPRDLLPHLKNADTIKVKPVQKKYTDSFQKEDIAKIRDYDLDVLIARGFRILKGDILNAARFGIWSYHHGDNRENRGMPACFWEVMEQWPETGVVLQILNEELDNGKIIYKSYSGSHPYSVSKSMNAHYWKASRFLPRVLKKLHHIGPIEFKNWIDHNNNDLYFYSKEIYKAPGNYKALKLISRHLLRFLKMKINARFYRNQWVLMYRFDKSISTSVSKYKTISPPKDRFWADPHIISWDDKYYIFFEELIYKEGRGKIAFMEITKDGTTGKPETILEKPYHLSYPHVFEYQGSYYMIPESSKNNTVDLYVAKDFPRNWTYVMTLLEGISAVDTTTLFYDDKVWLFMNVRPAEGGSSTDELYIFYADTLLTNNWVSHPMNPVISDVKRARPGGSFFFHNGNLYRPSQINIITYGYGINFNLVTKLSTDDYQERVLSTIEPKWAKNVIATHSFGFHKGLSVIDVLIRRKI